MSISTATVTPIFDNSKLMNQFSTFLKKQEKEGTRKEYFREINRYFDYLCEKEIVMDKQLNVSSYIVEGDLIVEQSDVQNYQTFLQTEAGLGNSSVTKAISVIRSLYGQLAGNNIPVKYEWFLGLKKLGKDTVEYAAFTYDQTVQAMEIVRNTELGDMKAALIKTAIYTGFRLNELRSIKLKNIKLFEGKTWIVTIIGKRGKKNVKPIPNELYDELIELNNKYKGKEGRLFSLARNTVNKMMKLIRKELNLETEDGEEKYVFHSFKKCAVVEVYNVTNGDIKEMQEIGNHSDPAMTIGIYTKLEKNKRIHNAASLRIGTKIDVLPKLENFTKEQILELIAQCSQSVHIEIESLLN